MTKKKMTYEERFPLTKENAGTYCFKPHPDFCEECFSKMHQCEQFLRNTNVPYGVEPIFTTHTVFKTELKDVDGDKMYEPVGNGTGGSNVIVVRPYLFKTDGDELYGDGLWHGAVGVSHDFAKSEESISRSYTLCGGT